MFPLDARSSAAAAELLSSSPSPPDTHYDSAFPQELISA